ncbi:dipeptide ABC transporter ATP-binding protein [Nitrospirillum amazonense]|uniref:ABC transporter ATP-binding protein n=1 Tax=Nitrospirillum amazonense TaxID=28077 RepID=UPI002DD4438A|nr:dipeptide ABC transporter ATP-binding protein [Nitrospirillum amazonense]MEC4594107.1 dipeptide ABC transporter ATP-binding protein [Nitrospirillum amazonense]
MALLDIRDFSLAIDGRAILSAVSLTVEPGQIVALVGTSGSGKSMTALSVLGLTPAGARTQGSIRLDGRELTTLTDRHMNAVRGRDVGLVFQEPMTALNPVLSIGAQVAETVRVHGMASRAEATRIADAMLTRVGLPADRFPRGRRPHELSGGQRQRVAIAAALALKPKLLIADEPTTALDVTTQARILGLLVDLVRQDGLGLLLISHDLALVSRVADRVVVLHEGAVVEAGEPATAFAAPQHPYTRRLLAATEPARQRPDVLPAPAQPPLLVAEGIVRDYPLPRAGWWSKPAHLRAVDQASLAVHRGESVGIVGESGSGKSTLLRTLLAADAPQAGAVRLLDQPWSAAPEAARRPLRRHVQMVFQDPVGSFDPRWRVERLVAEPLALLDAPLTPALRRARVEELLTQVGLAPADADRHPHEFSGGQRQRIAIARALAVQPDLIALDEATSALDVLTRAQILDLLGDLSRRLGLAYLVVSHDLAVVRALTDRLLVMQGGCIVEEGPTLQVLSRPQHPYTASLLAATPTLAAHVA